MNFWFKSSKTIHCQPLFVRIFDDKSFSVRWLTWHLCRFLNKIWSFTPKLLLLSTLKRVNFILWRLVLCIKVCRDLPLPKHTSKQNKKQSVFLFVWGGGNFLIVLLILPRIQRTLLKYEKVGSICLRWSFNWLVWNLPH